MPSLPRRAVRDYALGLLSLFVGAGMTGASGSMWPLAMGGAVAVMCTAALVRDIRARAAERRRR